MKTWNAKPGEVEQKWWLVDAEGKTLGRMATQIATVLRGKNKPQFTPHVDVGDYIVVINSDKVKMSGKKWDKKKYFWRSRYFGSIKEASAKEMREKDSTKIIQRSVELMLPKNKLSRQVIKKLKIYSGSEHPHAAQKLEAMNLEEKQHG